jgi:MFS superfamily sulfate permease-like transporter
MEFFEEDSISKHLRLASPGLVVYTFRGPLCSDNAESFLYEVLSLIHGASSAPRWLVVDFDLIAEIDYCGAKILKDLRDRMVKQGVTLVFAGLSEEVVDFLSDLGLLPALRRDNVFESVEAVFKAYETLHEGPQHSAPETRPDTENWPVPANSTPSKRLA